MATAAELAIMILARDNASRELRSVKGELAGVQREASALSRTLGTGLKVGAAAAVTALAALAVKGISAASDLNEAVSKANVTFGESAREIKAFAADSASALGVSERAANEYTATLGNILQAAGITKQASAEMSIELVQLAADVASFNNLSFDVSLEKIRAGLVGEAEPLRTVGVLLSEAAVQASAYAAGIAKQGDTLTEAQKVQARFQIILDQTKNAQGDFGRTSEGVANQQRILAAEFENTAASLGAKLQPAYKLALGTGITFVKTMRDTLTVIDENKDLIIAFGATALGGVLVPRLAAATQAAGAFFSTLNATATAQRVSTMTALVRSLSLASGGLPALAIGAEAAGLGIFGLARAFSQGASEGEKLRKELDAIGEAAELRNADAGIEQGAELARTYRNLQYEAAALEAEHIALERAMTSAQKANEEGIHSTSRVGDAYMRERAALRENEDALEAVREKQQAAIASGRELGRWVNQFQIAAAMQRTGAGAETVAELFPVIAEAAAQEQQPLGEFVEGLATGEDAAKEAAGAVKELAGALSSDLVQALKDVANVTTQEELAIEVQIAAQEALRARIIARAGGIEDELLPAQAKQIKSLDRTLEQLNAEKDAINRTQEAQGLRVAQMATAALPTQRELNQVIRATRDALDDQQTKEFLATLKAQGLDAALQKLRDQGLENVANKIEKRLNPKLDESSSATQRFVDKITQALNPALDGVASRLSSAALMASGFYSTLANFGSLTTAIDIFNSLRGLGGQPSAQPQGYAMGGDVPGPVGKAQLAVVHGGERVLSVAQRRMAADHARLFTALMGQLERYRWSRAPDLEEGDPLNVAATRAVLALAPELRGSRGALAGFRNTVRTLFRLLDEQRWQIEQGVAGMERIRRKGRPFTPFAKDLFEEYMDLRRSQPASEAVWSLFGKEGEYEDLADRLPRNLKDMLARERYKHLWEARKQRAEAVRWSTHLALMQLEHVPRSGLPFAKDLYEQFLQRRQWQSLPETMWSMFGPRGDYTDLADRLPPALRAVLRRRGLATGGIITEPTFAFLGETERSRPEIVSPEGLMRKVVREEAGASRTQNPEPRTVYNFGPVTAYVEREDDLWDVVARAVGG